eukprot:sb/3464486/
MDLAELAGFVKENTGSTLNDLTMDLIPVLGKLHPTFDPVCHMPIITAIRESCPNKEIVLVCSEQLSLSPCCLFSLPILLPLFDLTLPYNSAWLAETLPRVLRESEICSQCQDKDVLDPIHSSLMNCLRTFDMKSSCVEEFREVLRYIIRQTEPKLSPAVMEILPKFQLDLASVLRNCNSSDDNGDDDVVSIIVVNSIPDHMPLVYNPSYLFKTILPWLLSFFSHHPAHEDSSHQALDVVHYFSNTLTSLSDSPPNTSDSPSNTSDLEDIVRRILEMGVSNPSEVIRQQGVRTARVVLSKLKTSTLLKMCERFISDSSSDISGFFIDQFRGVVTKQKSVLDRAISKRILSFILSEEPFDVLEKSSKLLATLSLLYLLPSETSTGFVKTVEGLVQLKEMELRAPKSSPPAPPQGQGEMSVSVLGEVVKEPSQKERDTAVEVALCRLDLVKFRLAVLGERRGI